VVHGGGVRGMWNSSWGANGVQYDTEWGRYFHSEQNFVMVHFWVGVILKIHIKVVEQMNPNNLMTLDIKCNGVTSYIASHRSVLKTPRPKGHIVSVFERRTTPTRFYAITEKRRACRFINLNMP